MKTKTITQLFLFMLGVNFTCISQTNMPSFFSNNMILQQQENVAIWGTDAPGAIIEVHTSWGAEKVVKTKANGKWETNILTKEASFEKQEITVQGSSKIVLHNILIGEVWFCSGQSNMEWPMDGKKKSPVNNAEELIATSSNANIRLFNTERSASLSLKDNVIGSWAEATSESVQEFSAVGYLFARKLFEELQIPIGIIEASWGGTKIESWLPKDRVEKYTDIKIPDSLSKKQSKNNRPTLQYNAMIYPFKNYNIKGFLWYQGESNCNYPKPYKDYIHTLINSWRAQWRQKNLPFYSVQIAPYSYHEIKDTPIINANLIREAQSLVVQEIPNTGVVITNDIGQCDNIHPPEKNILAKRLANLALAEQYSFKNISYRGPEYKSMKIRKNKVIIAFNFYGKNKDNQSFDSTKALKNFVIAGSDHIFYPAKVKINKNQKLTIYSDKVKKPVAVRYGFEDCLEGSLFSKSGLPVSLFRTDTWGN
jgi:sialate O-acetylesterase